MIVEEDDVDLASLLTGGMDLLGQLANRDVHFAVWRSHFDAKPTGDSYPMQE